jgi:hypothetical protein
VSLPRSLSFWVLDVDGVVADTRSAVKLAYKAAGVEQPDDVWGLSWKFWLPSIVGDAAPEVHKLKQTYYESLLEEGAAEPLPGADLARALIDAGQSVQFITSASQRSAHAVLKSLRIDYSRLVAAEVTHAERVKYLLDVKVTFVTHPAYSPTHFTYVDDREEGADVADKAGWLFTHARWTR